MRHRVPILLAWVILGVLPSACNTTEGPESVVRRFDDLVRGGKWDEALALVDLDAKATRMLGDLYAKAPESDRKVTCELWGRRLKANTETAYRLHFKDGPGEISLASQADGKAEVTQREGDFVLVYSLEARPGGWIILDRTHEKDGVRPSVERGMSMVLKRIARELGRPPTLADVNERLDYYMDRTRERILKVTGPGGAGPGTLLEPGAGTGTGKGTGTGTGTEGRN